MISPVHQRLREATRVPHERLEARLQILRRIADAAERRALVMGFFRLHAAIEAAAAPWLSGLAGLDFEARRRTAVLRRDLAAHGLRPPAPASASAAAADACEALGLMYVLEGSTLGGRVIRRDVAARGGDFTGLEFLDPYGERAGERWRSFLGVLEERVASPEEAGACVRGAVAGFRHAERILCDEPLHV